MGERYEAIVIGSALEAPLRVVGSLRSGPGKSRCSSAASAIRWARFRVPRTIFRATSGTCQRRNKRIRGSRDRLPGSEASST